MQHHQYQNRGRKSFIQLIILFFIVCNTMAGREEVKEPIVIVWDGGHEAPGGVEADEPEPRMLFSEDTLSSAIVRVNEGDDAYLKFNVCGYKDKTVMIQAERDGRYNKPKALRLSTNNLRGYRKYNVHIKVTNAQLTDDGEWCLRAFNAPNRKVLKLRKTLRVKKAA